MVALDFKVRFAREHGLARAPLFRSPEVENSGDHEVLLDGAFGSVLVSTGRAVDLRDACSWAWSSNIPHHIQVLRDKLQISRWDDPNNRYDVNIEDALEPNSSFYYSLRRDQIKSRENIIRRSLAFFRKIRNIVHHQGFDDTDAMMAYLSALDYMLDGNQLLSASADDRGLLSHARSIFLSLPSDQVAQSINDFLADEAGLRLPLKVLPQLALRHASGTIFQEAHFELVAGRPADMFGYVEASRSRRISRGSVHFTPAPLARAIAEQALSRLEGLHSRKTLTVADFTCGSGAFLIEALRVLERLRYKGIVKLVGRDISAPAVEMAKFSVCRAAAEWPGTKRCKIDLRLADSLIEELPSNVDIVLMNPPFIRWQNTKPGYRASLLEVAGGRSDLSVAFVSRAIDHLAPDGILASLLPVSILESKSHQRWRDVIAKRGFVSFEAIFDNLRIFPQATVRVGSFIVGPSGAELMRTRLRAGGGVDDADEALRTLRKGIAAKSTLSAPGRFSISVLPVGSGDWGPNSDRFVAIGRTAKSFPVDTTVSSMFHVRQGIRSGWNKSFVLSDADFLRLPLRERKYFRKAISSRGIMEGDIVERFNVFYPYGNKFVDNEGDLRSALPTYYANHLLPYKDQLAQRGRAGAAWWLLSERRAWIEAERPMLYSKYFSGPGGFVVDTSGEALILQGYAWIPKSSWIDSLGKHRDNYDLAAAYLTILNSSFFFALVGEYAPAMKGGQRDLSPRYINGVPLVDISRLSSTTLGELIDLSASHQCLTGNDDRAERLVAEIFDRRDAWKGGAERMPSWVQAIVVAGKAGLTGKERVNILKAMRRLAHRGLFSEIDDALRGVDVTALDLQSIVMLLRGTYSFRERLKHWFQFKERVSHEFVERGEATTFLLRGLS